MKLIKLFSLFLVATLAVSCGKKNLANVPKDALKTNIDSISYALGMDVGKNVNVTFESLNNDLFMAAYLKAVKGDSKDFLIDKTKSSSLLQSYFQKNRQKITERQQAIAKKEMESKYGDVKAASEKFLEENKTKPGVKTTASGLQYIVIKPGTGKKPTAKSRVEVNYHGTLIDGTVFDSSVDRGKSATFGVSQVIKGWTEGLQLMKEGAKYKFFIPQDLAYGTNARGGKIRPFDALIFEVDLLKVIDPKETKTKK